MTLIIRKATQKDIPAIVKVRHTAFTEKEVEGFTTPTPSIYCSPQKLMKEWVHDNVLKQGWEIFVAENNQKIVGFIVFKLNNDFGYIDNINVAKTMQGKGIGKALVEYVEKLAKSAGIDVMKTDTTENLSGISWKSYAFWQKLGYKDTGARLTTRYSFKEIPFVKNLK